MKRWDIILVIIIFVSIMIFNLSCTNAAGKTVSSEIQTDTQSTSLVGVKDLDCQEAFKTIQNNSNNPEFVILDVRTAQEYAGGHIVKAVNIDFQSEDFTLNVSKLDKNYTYLVYCQAGGRSAKASQAMFQLGFRGVLNLSGGITQWEAKRYPVQK
jgi:rhodanese-related sulfurtransferase